MMLYVILAPRASNWEPDQRNGRDKRPNIKWGKLMAAEKAQNLQDTFLNHVRKSKTSVTIFLVNGVKLQGFVTWFDNFCVLLRRDGHSQPGFAAVGHSPGEYANLSNVPEMLNGRSALLRADRLYQ